MRKIAYATMFSIAAGLASAAQAQTALGNGVTMTSTATQPQVSGLNAIELGDFSQSTVQTLVSKMPMSLSYGSVDVGISFTGTSGVYDGGGWWVPGPQNYLMAGEGAVTLQFSQSQTYFETRWASRDTNNVIQFYKGDQLLASKVGGGWSENGTVAFNFTELGFDKVVASAYGGGFEFDQVRFGGPAPEAAPVPLGSAGGLIAFSA